MRELYKMVDEAIDSINFEKIWRRFSKFNFALYDNDNVYFKNETILRDNRFLGNTSIEYNGEFIAIWHVDNPNGEDCQTLAANLVHEMFHAFQRTHSETRYPNDLKMLDYPDCIENYAIKHMEHLFLVDAFSCSDISTRKEFLEKFLSARKYRETLIGEIIKQEYLAETTEGIAEYAGIMALKQISHEKYVVKINAYIEKLKCIDNNFFDIRRMSYYTGAMLCVLLSEMGINIFHKIGETENPLFTIIARLCMCFAETNFIGVNFDIEDLAEKTKKYTNDKKIKFDEFFKTHNNTVEGNYTICGYDPMNMIKTDNMILCNHFVMLKGSGNDEPLFIQGPVVVNLKKDSFNQVISYAI